MTAKTTTIMHPDRYQGMLEHRPADLTDEQFQLFQDTAVLNSLVPPCYMIFVYRDDNDVFLGAQIIHYHADQVGPEIEDAGYYADQDVALHGVDGGTPMSLDDLLGDEVAELIRQNKMPR